MLLIVIFIEAGLFYNLYLINSVYNSKQTRIFLCSSLTQQQCITMKYQLSRAVSWVAELARSVCLSVAFWLFSTHQPTLCCAPHPQTLSLFSHHYLSTEFKLSRHIPSRYCQRLSHLTISQEDPSREWDIIKGSQSFWGFKSFIYVRGKKK